MIITQRDIDLANRFMVKKAETEESEWHARCREAHLTYTTWTSRVSRWMKVHPHMTREVAREKALLGPPLGQETGLKKGREASRLKDKIEHDARISKEIRNGYRSETQKRNWQERKAAKAYFQSQE